MYIGSQQPCKHKQTLDQTVPWEQRCCYDISDWMIGQMSKSGAKTRYSPFIKAFNQYLSPPCVQTFPHIFSCMSGKSLQFKDGDMANQERYSRSIIIGPCDTVNPPTQKTHNDPQTHCIHTMPPPLQSNYHDNWGVHKTAQRPVNIYRGYSINSFISKQQQKTPNTHTHTV